MAMEKNHQTLQETLRRLPTYEPPLPLWSAIERQLENEAALADAAHNLPTYAPPAVVWERILHDLETPAKVRRLRPAWIGAAAVAVVLLVAGSYLWNSQIPEPVEKVQVVYAEIEPLNSLIKLDWDDDDALMQEVAEAFAQKATFIQNTETQSLLSEWEDLNRAKAEIKTMLVKYGNDADLIRTIAVIERQRSAIVKQMAVNI